jgi:hypothetical protein
MCRSLVLEMRNNPQLARDVAAPEILIVLNYGYNYPSPKRMMLARHFSRGQKPMDWMPRCSPRRTECHLQPKPWMPPSDVYPELQQWLVQREAIFLSMYAIPMLVQSPLNASTVTLYYILWE